MYSGLEVRVPFCDHRIVEYAYNMPWDFKSLEGREKGIVRRAFADELPKEIVYRKKSPYPKTFHPVYTRLCAGLCLPYFRRITPRSPLPCSTGMPCKNSCSGRKALPNRGSDS